MQIRLHRQPNGQWRPTNNPLDSYIRSKESEFPIKVQIQQEWVLPYY